MLVSFPCKNISFLMYLQYLGMTKQTSKIHSGRSESYIFMFLSLPRVLLFQWLPAGRSKIAMKYENIPTRLYETKCAVSSETEP